MDDDPFNLRRFTEAQAAVIERVRAELRKGEKRSHWMWFIFPQIAGLGTSAMAKTYAIASKDEAEAFLRHPVLGPRLVECANLVNRIEGRTIEQVLGSIDAMKFRSSMTLFSGVPGGDSVFADALEKYFGGEPDQATLERLR